MVQTRRVRKLVITPEARAEVRDVLVESRRKFGLVAQSRYRLLIETAYRDLLSYPLRPGVSELAGIPSDIRLYPIRHSRRRTQSADRVGRARHVIAFRFDEKRVEILRLLHDSMDLPTRLG